MTGRITWFNCTHMVGDLYAPFVTARLGVAGKTVKIKFLVDSGASLSMVPRHEVSGLFHPDRLPADTDSDLKDASGKRLKGFVDDFDIEILGAAKLPVTRSRLLIGSEIKWAVLGMTWFEKLGVHFRNFADTPQGRRFALYPGP